MCISRCTLRADDVVGAGAAWGGGVTSDIAGEGMAGARVLMPPRLVPLPMLDCAGDMAVDTAKASPLSSSLGTPGSDGPACAMVSACYDWSGAPTGAVAFVTVAAVRHVLWLSNSSAKS